MDKNFKKNAVVALNEISKLVEDIEKKVSVNNTKVKECEEFKILKEKCCDRNPIVSLNGFYAIRSLVEKKILVGSQTISVLVSLLPSISQHGALVSTIGNILLFDLQAQALQTGEFKCPYSGHFQHPFILILKYNWEKSWFEVYHFVLQLMQNNEDIKLEDKIIFLRPLFRQIFWRSSWRGSQCQLKLFSTLLLESHEEKILDFTLEVLLWQELDIHYCLFLQDYFMNFLRKDSEGEKTALAGMTPTLALAINWLIINGHNPGSWLQILAASLEADGAGGSVVLCILTDVLMQTPSSYINPLVDVCKSIILSGHCNKYVVHKFVGVILNWFASPSSLAVPLYKSLEEILEFVSRRGNKWSDRTWKLAGNRYYKAFGSRKTQVKFAVDLILCTSSWSEEKTSVVNWLKNLTDSDQREMQFRLHSFIQGVILAESDREVIELCLEILFKLIEEWRELSFSLLCLLFYKLGKETDPNLQRIYLFSLPRLSVKKENIPVIVGIIESLKRGSSKVMRPLVVQLYLWLWKFDKRTYSYLHKMLHDDTSCDFPWELNVSRAIALKEICRLAPHLHAKDLVGVLSKILNECSGSVSGLPSAIAIEAVTDLCKAYVIDVAGTWNAIQPKLRLDERPQVISSLCRFFGDVPNLNSGQNEELTRDIVSMLWNYASSKDAGVVRAAFQALSKFSIENLPLKWLPEAYRVDLKFPKDFDKNSKTAEDLLGLTYVPAECWIQFLEKIDEEVLEDGGKLIVALLERELAGMPRGLFYLPPEKPEPLTYSYLPPRSVCRCLVEFLQKGAKENSKIAPERLKEATRILSREYSKLLPPLDWGFSESLMALGWQFSAHCLTLLARQGSVSASAKSILEKYFASTKWDREKTEEILFVFNLLPLLYKAVPYGILQNFLEQTLQLCLETSLSENSRLFGNLLQTILETLKSKSVQAGHKKLLAKQLERVLASIPADHELMKNYAECATEFPVQSIEELTSVKDEGDVDVSWLRRAVTIRCAIALRSDIKNPLVWLNEFTETVARVPNEQNFVLNAICHIIRSRRSCDHRSWVQELTWRIQASITNSSSNETIKVTLFLVDVFITVVVTLSGHDCLFADADEFAGNYTKKLDVFPQALTFLFSFPDWSDMLPKVGLWLQKLLNWKHLPDNRVKVFLQALLTLREVNYYEDENDSANLLNLFSV